MTERTTAHYSDPRPLVFVPERPEWHRGALCRGRTDWFSMEPADARAVCARCPVKASCLAAGKDEQFGVWGGQDRDAMRTHRQRHRDRERKRRAAAGATMPDTMRGSSARSEQLIHNQKAAGSNPARATIDQGDDV